MSGDVSILILYELSVRFSTVRLHVSMHLFLKWIVVFVVWLVNMVVVVEVVFAVVVLTVVVVVLVWFKIVVVVWLDRIVVVVV